MEQEKQERVQKFYKQVNVGLDKVALFGGNAGLVKRLQSECPGLLQLHAVVPKGQVKLVASSKPALAGAVARVTKVAATMVQTTMTVPRERARELRDQRHRKLKQGQAATGAWLHLDAQNVLHIIGTPKQVQKAERFIERALEVSETMELGSNAGLVVGVKGATIRAISESSGARLHVDDKGLLTVTGSEESVTLAWQQVDDIIDRRSTGAKKEEKKAAMPPAPSPVQPAAAAPSVAPVPSVAPPTAAPAVTPPAQPAAPAQAPQAKVVWLWQGDQGEWNQYDFEMEKALERLHRLMAPDYSGAIAYFKLSGCDYQVKRSSNGHLVQINVQTQRERAVKRKDEAEEDRKRKMLTSSKEPWYWRMPHHDDNEAKLYDLSTTDSLYHIVKNRFFFDPSNSKYEVLSVQFVQCPRRWRAYAFNRKQYVASGGRTDIKYERELWHGTAVDNVPKIAAQGFLRQFGQRQSYGDGVYFAANSAYSANTSYAVPDQRGHQRMFLCKVLVGEYCLGTHGMQIPPPKASNKNETYDSLVDCTRKPSLFVIARDDHAYAEYIVTFKVKQAPPPVRVPVPASAPASSTSAPAFRPAHTSLSRQAPASTPPAAAPPSRAAVPTPVQTPPPQPWVVPPTPPPHKPEPSCLLM